MAKPVVLSIAGSDNSAGAGAQADLKAITAQGGYALTALTCVVAEVPGKVSAVQAVKPEIVREQIRLSFEAFPIAAVKTGMLYSQAIIRTVAEELSVQFRALKTKPWLIVDPVMVASSGDPLLRPGAMREYLRRLFPLADVITPNLDELSILAGEKITTLERMREAGKRLSDKYGAAFLLKGGHLRGSRAVDLLVESGRVHRFEAPFIRGVDTHGTGCTYASALAAQLALGKPLPEAVAAAKHYLTSAIRRHLRWKGTHALEHFPARALA
ncbi:MAG TPA: bifunctional hydroxymethylpyrimidine kinase/phosphomethylpyrimidine kinase [Chthoniobacterales bacterium]